MSHHHATDFPKKKLHHDWRFIVAVVLMLIAIVAYVLTLDDRMIPAPHSQPDCHRASQSLTIEKKLRFAELYKICISENGGWYCCRASY